MYCFNTKMYQIKLLKYLYQWFPNMFGLRLSKNRKLVPNIIIYTCILNHELC